MAAGQGAHTTALAWIGRAVNRTIVLPLVVFFPTSRCNSRCLSCSWWRHSGADDLTLPEIETVAGGLRQLGTRLVVFSGGEPLLRPDVFAAAGLFRRANMRLHLLTSGLALSARAEEVARVFGRVIISLDAATDAAYAEIRGVDGLKAVERGVGRLRALAPALPIHARATLHRSNFRSLPALIRKARELRLDGISFLAADVSANAFGRVDGTAPPTLLLSRDELRDFRALIDRTLTSEPLAFSTRFVAHGADGVRRVAQHYAAMLGDEAFPPARCDAPWVSAVIEANGDVRPCFFHPPVGNLRRAPLTQLLRRHLPSFRTTLDVAADEGCRRCVCSLKVHWRETPWN